MMGGSFILQQILDGRSYISSQANKTTHTRVLLGCFLRKYPCETSVRVVCSAWGEVFHSSVRGETPGAWVILGTKPFEGLTSKQYSQIPIRSEVVHSK